VRWLLDKLTNLPYVRLDERLAFAEIYWGDDRSTNRESSGDQAFGLNRVFQSAAGDVAISFGTHALSAAEMEQLPVATTPTVATRAAGTA
jgi:hypothetical protein